MNDPVSVFARVQIAQLEIFDLGAISHALRQIR